MLPPHLHQQPKSIQQNHNANANPYTTPYGMALSSQTPYGPHVPIGANGNGANSAGPGAPPGLGAPTGMGIVSGTVAPSSEEISTIFVVGFPEDMQEREFQNMFTFSQGFEAATLKIPNKEFTSYGGILGAQPPGPTRGPTVGGYQGYGGSNDPYNLVTVNQGGVVVDAGRDGTMASWPASAPGEEGHYLGGAGMGAPGGAAGMGQGQGAVPRKQIIGFAKFRSREEALAARDVLQGRRVDIEKGAVLKAEMAKKNLHTKRGVGPVPGNAPAGGNGIGVGASGAAAGMMQGLGMNGAGMSDVYGLPGEGISNREREIQTIGAMGLAPSAGRLNQWRDQMHQQQQQQAPEPTAIPNSGSSLGSSAGLSHVLQNGGVREREREEEERRREREAGVLNAMGLSTGAQRGARERAEDEDRERRRKEKDMRLRAGNSMAFDAFHSVPAGISRQASNATNAALNGTNGGLSPPNESGGGTSPMMGNVNAFAHRHQQQLQQQLADETFRPWGKVLSPGDAGQMTPVRPRSSSQRSTSPSNLVQSDGPRSFSPSLETQQQFHQQQNARYARDGAVPVHSGASSISGQSQTDEEIAKGVNGLAVSTGHPQAREHGGDGNTSPQLPSPASASGSGAGSASSGSGLGRGAVDQNPPINTLYVGNLPTSPPPAGFPQHQDYLEDSLRELFSSRPGFRRLCFRQKNNGPMCFVEFEDVNHATKALNDLYGNTLKGLIKGGGIRLSYSKNPLGVRTPTSAASSGPVLQQQQAQHLNQQAEEQAHPVQRPTTILRRDMNITSPPASSNPSYNNTYMASPPPRFFSSSPPNANMYGTMSTSTSTPLTGSTAAFVPRSAHGGMFGYNAGGSLSTFSPFGLSSPPSSHSTIPGDHTPAAGV
ncbi:hypothetical protein BD779DRAFT_1667792 [Infundibulicybe gibba]|nr:hypothetical protein BD779DRAFT_1667792 [Infundibulicybe gibba]